MAVLALSCFGRRMTVARFCCRCCCCVRCATCVFGQLFSPAAGGTQPIQQAAAAAACMSCCAGEPKRVPRNTHAWSCCAGEPKRVPRDSMNRAAPVNRSACNARHGCDDGVKWTRSTCGHKHMRIANSRVSSGTLATSVVALCALRDIERTNREPRFALCTSVKAGDWGVTRSPCTAPHRHARARAGHANARTRTLRTMRARVCVMCARLS